MKAKDIIKLAGDMSKSITTASDAVTTRSQAPAMKRHAQGIIRQTPRLGYSKWTKGGGSKVLKRELKSKLGL